MNQLIFATANEHKVSEFNNFLDGLGFELCTANIVGGMPNVLEDGDSFAANALLKARALRVLAPKTSWVLSDDSGLEVDALNGAPGIKTARYAGQKASDCENIEKLLSELSGLSMSERKAQFLCVLCLIDHEGNQSFYEGCCPGTIALKPSGLKGFGYDPIFIPDGYKQSFGQLGMRIKDEHSHRALAVRALRNYLMAYR